MIDRTKLRRWYDFQAPFYSLWRDRYRSPLVLRVAALLNDNTSESGLLDAGCGTGLFTIGLALCDKRWRIEGLDASSGMLAVARRKARRLNLENVDFLQGDVTRAPHADSTFDCVVAAGLFPNLDRPEQALREFARLLRPGGRLLVIEVDRASMSVWFRSFFKLMVLGYRAFSRLAPRFRFADDWSLERSTIDRPAFEEQLGRAGFYARSVEKAANHLIFQLVKAP